MNPPSSKNPLRKKPPRMVDIAEKLGLSLSTISRALKDHPSIPETTRERVKEAAEQIGYIPNPYISALMHSVKTGKPVPYRATLALVDTLETPTKWKKFRVQQDFNEGVYSRARALGFHVERHWAPLSDNPEKLTRILRARGIHGVLIPPLPSKPDKQCNLPLQPEHFTVVTVGFRLENPAFNFCQNDQLFTAKLTYEKLVEKGYKKIGLLVSDYIEDILDRKFSMGFQNAALSSGHDLPENSRCCFIEKDPRANRVIQKWINSYQPDAVCGTPSDLQLLLDTCKVSVPDKLALAYLNMNDDFLNVSGVDQHNVLVGSSAVDLLVQSMYKNEHGIPDTALGVVIEGKWVDGNTAPIKAKI